MIPFGSMASLIVRMTATAPSCSSAAHLDRGLDDLSVCSFDPPDRVLVVRVDQRTVVEVPVAGVATARDRNVVAVGHRLDRFDDVRVP
jgi:hypothetical protein